MKKVLIAALVGGIIQFIWGFLAWAVLPLHTPSIHTMANEDAVVASLQSGMDKKAVYLFPAPPKMGVGDDQQQQVARETWEKKYQQGPRGMVVFDPSGSSPMKPADIVAGFINCLLTAGLAAWMLSRSTAASAGFVARVAFCGALGIFASLVTHVAYWNWMNFPSDYTTAMIADTVIGWVLTGMGIGTVVKGSAA